MKLAEIAALLRQAVADLDQLPGSYVSDAQILAHTKAVFTLTLSEGRGFYVVTIAEQENRDGA